MAAVNAAAANPRAKNSCAPPPGRQRRNAPSSCGRLRVSHVGGPVTIGKMGMAGREKPLGALGPTAADGFPYLVVRRESSSWSCVESSM